jgi:DNA-directed RNA polymerase subunit omega
MVRGIAAGIARALPGFDVAGGKGYDDQYLWRESVNQELLETARLRVPSVPVLVNMVSKRVKQLNAGMRPYVRPLTPDEDKLDIALREIGEGKLIAEVDFDAVAKHEADQTKWS